MAKLQSTFLSSARCFAPLWPALAELREACGLSDDVQLDPIHFLTAGSEARRSCSAACWDNGRLTGVLFAYEHYSRGIRTGYAVGGDWSGRGLVACRPEDETAVLAAAVECIFSSGVHSLELRYVPRAEAPANFPGLIAKQFNAVIPGDRMRLPPDYEAFLQVLGKHTRRNVRYYRRKTVEEHICFEPVVTPEEFGRERDRLNRTTHFPCSNLHLERDDRLLMLHRGGERMALRAQDGSLVALLCGFILGGRFHLLSQWNDPGLEKLSLSTVLRGYMVEHIIERGCTELLFMGGSSFALGRFCEPQRFRLIVVDRASGAMALGKRLLAGIPARPQTRSTEIDRLCGAFLDDARIIQRTVLAQAMPPLSAP